MLSLLSPTGIALPTCHLASPLDAPPPLNVLASCNMGLVVVTSPLVAPLPLNMPAGCHAASQCTTLLFAPAGCRVTSPLPPPLNALTCCHLASNCAAVFFIPAGCCFTPQCNTASQCVGWLYGASHCATLTFDPAGCCVTPCRHHCHPLGSRRHLAIHVSADKNLWLLSQLCTPQAQMPLSSRCYVIGSTLVLI